MSDELLTESEKQQIAVNAVEAWDKERASSFAAPAGWSAPVECEESVIDKIRIRRNAGRKKYGTTMERADLDKIQWLQHAQEEAMDLAIYLERLMREERKNSRT